MERQAAVPASSGSFFARVRDVVPDQGGDPAFYLDTLFAGVPLAGRTVLDIGAGSGLFGFYAAMRGARRVVCLEPEAAGSTQRVTATFDRLQQVLGLPQVTLLPDTLQTFQPNGERFDVVLLHNSINHLDEPACRSLLDDPEAVRTYDAIFAQLAGLLSPGGTLLLADCSRHNFWDRIGRRNPFAPAIDWEIHQSPQTWARLLRRAGFSDPRISWNAPSKLGPWGRRMLGHALPAYFVSSHFTLRMTAPRTNGHTGQVA